MKKKNLKSRLSLTVKDLSALAGKLNHQVKNEEAFLTNLCTKGGCCTEGDCTFSCVTEICD